LQRLPAGAPMPPKLEFREAKWMTGAFEHEAHDAARAFVKQGGSTRGNTRIFGSLHDLQSLIVPAR